MECLNLENANKNMGRKRRAQGQKPASLEAAGMKKPAANTTVVEASKESAQAAATAAAQDNESSSDVDLGCLNCGS